MGNPVVDRFLRQGPCIRLVAEYLLSRSVARDLNTPANIHEYPRRHLRPILESRTPLLFKPLMRAYYWPIGAAIRPCVYPMRKGHIFASYAAGLMLPQPMQETLSPTKHCPDAVLP